MFESFYNGLLSGMNSNQTVKFGLIILLLLSISLKIVKWWGNFKNKV